MEKKPCHILIEGLVRARDVDLLWSNEIYFTIDLTLNGKEIRAKVVRADSWLADINAMCMYIWRHFDDRAGRFRLTVLCNFTGADGTGQIRSGACWWSAPHEAVSSILTAVERFVCHIPVAGPFRLIPNLYPDVRTIQPTQSPSRRSQTPRFVTLRCSV